MAIDRVGSDLQAARRQPVIFALQVAAEESGTSLEALMATLTSDPAREQVLTRTLKVAQDA
jgi:hypothetical protein